MTTLHQRLVGACGILLGTGHSDSALAVRQATEILSSMDDLRNIRQWHYNQFREKHDRAAEMTKKSISRMFKRDGRDEFARVADRYTADANFHLRIVQTLNAFFDEKDRVQ